MAYVARLRPARLALSGAALIPARGDKWYMDPEEERQFGSPFHIKYGGSFPITQGPSWHNDVYQNENSMYPRMPMYHRQLKNPYVKYDYGIGMRKNFGETFHILEEWLTPQGTEYIRDNGHTNNVAGTLDLILVIGSVWFLIQLMDWIDKNYCVNMYAPKVYPFDNLWVETGANPLVPSKDRAYLIKHIPVVGHNWGIQK